MIGMFVECNFPSSNLGIFYAHTSLSLGYLFAAMELFVFRTCIVRVIT